MAEYYTKKYKDVIGYINQSQYERGAKPPYSYDQEVANAIAGSSIPKEWLADPYKYYSDLEKLAGKDWDPSKVTDWRGQYFNFTISENHHDLGVIYGPEFNRIAALATLSKLEADPNFESFYAGRALGEAKREGQMGTTGKLFRPDTQFAPGYEGRWSKLGADMFQSGPGSGLNKPPAGGGNTGRGVRVIHSPLPTPKYDGTAPTTALGGQPVQGTQVTGGVFAGGSLPASDKPLAVAAPAKKPTRLGGY